MPWTYVVRYLNGQEIVGTFYEKELQKTNQKEVRAEKVIKRKGDIFYVKWKGYYNSFNSWIDKKDVVWMSEHFPLPKYLGGNVKFELDSSNLCDKSRFKKCNSLDTLKYSKKVDLASFKSKIVEVDIGKSETTPIDVSKVRM